MTRKNISPPPPPVSQRRKWTLNVGDVRQQVSLHGLPTYDYRQPDVLTGDTFDTMSMCAKDTGATSTQFPLAMLRELFFQSIARRSIAFSTILTSFHWLTFHTSRAILDILSKDSVGPSASALSRSKLSLCR